MRILLLTQFFWPEQRSAAMNLAAVSSYLVAQGHEVMVITGFPNHPHGRVYEGYRIKWRQWDVYEGVQVLRVPLYPDHSLSAIRRSLNYGSFALSAATIGAALSRGFRPDVLLVYLPSLANWLPLSALKWLHDMPVVLWETDLWPEALTATGQRLPSWIERTIRALDRAIHRQADKVCVNSPGLASCLIAKGVAEDRLEVITDWADETLFYPAAADPLLAARYGLDNRFNVIYGGNFGPAQNLSTLVHAAANLKDLEDLQVVFIGSGEQEALLRTLVEKMDLNNVRFLPRQPMNEIRKFFAMADALVVHLIPAPIYEMQIPSKIMAYLACGRPIICAIKGQAADLVLDAEAGLCCPPGDPVALANSIRSLHQLSPKRRQEYGERGRQKYLEKYTLKVQAKRFEGILRDVVN